MTPRLLLTTQMKKMMDNQLLTWTLKTKAALVQSLYRLHNHNNHSHNHLKNNKKTEWANKKLANNNKSYNKNKLNRK